MRCSPRPVNTLGKLGLFLVMVAGLGAALGGEVVSLPSTSVVLADSRIGLSAEREHRVLLPASYVAETGRRYPVVYYCHNFFWSPAQFFADGEVARLIEQATTRHGGVEFILVVTDYTGPTTGSLYENSATSGRWLDYTVDEVVPLIDRTYRTIPRSESRAVIGDFFGGRGALALAMKHPQVFGSVYAMHPVATGTGDLPWSDLGVDWPAIRAADQWSSLPESGRDRVFVAIAQAFLPRADRPPFFCDFPTDPASVRRAQQAFHLDEWLEVHAGALRGLRGLAFDWGRFDPTRAHVESNRRFSQLLREIGIAHEAEEFAGGVWDRMWGDDGRFASRVLPFLHKHLAVEQQQD